MSILVRNVLNIFWTWPVYGKISWIPMDRIKCVAIWRFSCVATPHHAPSSSDIRCIFVPPKNFQWNSWKNNLNPLYKIGFSISIVWNSPMIIISKLKTLRCHEKYVLHLQKLHPNGYLAIFYLGKRCLTFFHFQAPLVVVIVCELHHFFTILTFLYPF